MNSVWLTVTEAAARVQRSRRTIETWLAKGLTVTNIRVGRHTVRYIREDDLIAYFRSTFTKLHGRPIGVDPQAEQVAERLSKKYGLDNDFTLRR